jgi:hypothetical protein
LDVDIIGDIIFRKSYNITLGISDMVEKSIEFGWGGEFLNIEECYLWH